MRPRVTVLESLTEKNSVFTLRILKRNPYPYAFVHWFCVIFDRYISTAPIYFLYHILMFNLPLQ